MPSGWESASAEWREFAQGAISVTMRHLTKDTRPTVDYEFSSPQAVVALERLFNRLQEELTQYHDAAMGRGDHDRVKRAEGIRSWLQTDGRTVYSELLLKCSAGGRDDQEAMSRSIEAAMRRLEIAQSDGSEDLETQDMVCDWCQEILPSLRRSFRPFSIDDAREPESVGKELARPIDYTAYVREKVWLPRVELVTYGPEESGSAAA